MAQGIKNLIKKYLFETYIFLGQISDRIFGEVEKRAKGVDFLINVASKDLGNGFDAKNYVEYVPTKAWQIKKVVRQLGIGAHDSIFDFGCGKGKALYEFSKFPFKKIAGVEISNELVAIARTNMEKLNLDRIEIHHQNALDFKELDDYTIFFFFDPFNKEILEGVLDNIVESHNNRPREINLVYLNPRGHEETLESKGFLHSQTLQIPMKALFYRYPKSQYLVG